MIEKPTIESIRDELGRQKRTLEQIWSGLINVKNYVLPESLEDLELLGGWPTFTLSNKDFTSVEITSKPFFKKDLYLKKDKKLQLFRQYTDVLYKLHSLNRFVSYNCIYQNVVTEIKCVFVKRYENEFFSFDESLDGILKTILSQVKYYEFYNMVQGIELIDIKCIPFGDVELFKYQDNNDFTFEIVEDEKKFLNDFKNKICMRCKILGEHRYARESAMKKFNATLNCVRYIICLYAGDFLYKNQIKVNFPEKSLDKVGVSFCADLDDKSLIYTRNMPDAFENFKLSKQIYDESKKWCLLSDVQRIMICEEEKSEWENLIADAIYWCGEAQNEYNLDVAFFKFWTAIETLIPSSRGDKVTEKVLNGATILYFYGILNHDNIDYKAEKKNLKFLYDKRSNIVHNGLNFAIKPTDLTEICKYVVAIIINAIFWSYKGYNTKKQVRNCFENLSVVNGLVRKKVAYNRVAQRNRFLKKHNKS